MRPGQSLVCLPGASNLQKRHLKPTGQGHQERASPTWGRCPRKDRRAQAQFLPPCPSVNAPYSLLLPHLARPGERPHPDPSREGGWSPPTWHLLGQASSHLSSLSHLHPISHPQSPFPGTKQHPPHRSQGERLVVPEDSPGKLSLPCPGSSAPPKSSHSDRLPTSENSHHFECHQVPQCSDSLLPAPPSLPPIPNVGSACHPLIYSFIHSAINEPLCV